MRLRPWLIVAVLVGIAGSPAAAEDTRTAFVKAVAQSRIFGFLEILRNSGIPEATLNEDVTMIIPVDTTFYTLTPPQYQGLLSPANKELAARYIRAHVVSGRLTIAQLAAGTYKSLGGIEIKAEPGGPGTRPTINGCHVTIADRSGTKGMFHEIDCFLFTP